MSDQNKNLLKGFKKPKSVIFQKEELNPNYGRFIAYPFEKGLGITIANSLRRTLLSCLQGYAITAIRIEYHNKNGENVLLSNEYESIHGVYEDTIIIIQRLKKVRLKLLDNSKNETIFLEKKGNSVLKASDFKINSNIEILNPNLEIATLNNEASIFLELQISIGRGYVPSEKNIDYIQTIGTVPIDAIFSPITNVKIDLSNVRIGGKADYDKFILEIWTDGSLNPDEAISDASKILKEHFNSFIHFQDKNEEENDVEENENHKMETLLNTPIESLELSVRSSNCLKIVGIKTIGELISKTEDEISKIKNLGKKSVIEISQKLESLNLTFNMNINQLKIRK